MPEPQPLHLFCPLCGNESVLDYDRTPKAKCKSCGVGIRTMGMGAAILEVIGGEYRSLADRNAIRVLKSKSILDIWGMANSLRAFGHRGGYRHLDVAGVEPGMNPAEISALLWKTLLSLPARTYEILILPELLRLVDSVEDLFTLLDPYLASGGVLIISDTMPWPFPLDGEERASPSADGDREFSDTTFQGMRGMKPKRTIGYSTFAPFLDNGYLFSVHRLGWPIDPLYQAGVATLRKPW